MADSARAARLSSRIKVIIAEALRSRVKDDAAEAITVTDVQVTNDLQHATVFYTVLAADDEQKAQVEELLRINQGVLRKEMGQQLSIRLTPTLEFRADEIPESAAHLEDLLQKAREQDEHVRALAANAEPVDPSPYRTDQPDRPSQPREGQPQKDQPQSHPATRDDHDDADGNPAGR